MRPNPPPGPDYDADVSIARNGVDDLGVGLAIWSYRREPDADARRAASDAVKAIDETLAALYRVRARLVTETREADDRTAARADELLARTGAPPGRETGDGPLPEGTASTQPGHHHAPEAAGMRITRGGAGGRAPREEAP